MCPGMGSPIRWSTFGATSNISSPSTSSPPARPGPAPLVILPHQVDAIGRFHTFELRLEFAGPRIPHPVRSEHTGDEDAVEGTQRIGERDVHDDTVGAVTPRDLPQQGGFYAAAVYALAFVFSRGRRRKTHDAVAARLLAGHERDSRRGGYRRVGRLENAHTAA